MVLSACFKGPFKIGANSFPIPKLDHRSPTWKESPKHWAVTQSFATKRESEHWM